VKGVKGLCRILGGDVDKGAGKWLNDKKSMAKQTAEEFLRGSWVFD